MVKMESRKLGDLLLLMNGIVLIVLINLLSSVFFHRFDLTEEKRYSIKPQTKEILKNLDDNVYIEVFLEGDLNPGFKRFQKAIRETLEEFRIYSDNKVIPVFTDPATAASEKARNEFMSSLASKGIQPTNVIENENGQRIEKLIFPGAIISYGGAEKGVMLLKGNKARTPEEEINQSIEGVEFELASAIYNLTSIERKHIALVKGHGELDSMNLASLYSALIEVYDVSDVELKDADLSAYDALVIAKPTKKFSVHDKYALDQYIMRGGNALMLLDRMEASMDSASQQDYFAFPYNTDLDDQLFKYGIRLNPDLIQDRTSALYPVVTGQAGGKPRMQLLDWPFFPLINRYADHPITRNLDAVIMRFASSMDTVKALGIKKTPLLFTSQYSRTVTAPVRVNVNALRDNIDMREFDKPNIAVAYLLEGKFTSLFKNRFLPEGIDDSKFKSEGSASKIIVVSDGDVAKNDYNVRARQPMPLGYDQATQYTFANRDLLLNMLAYLTDENGLISARNKEVKIRPLDKQRIQQERVGWQIINLVLPVFALIIFGVVRAVLRKRKYATFQ
jgi:ABC-2 type transport system permease protein